MLILVAEDNRASRLMLEKILKLDGHEILSAEDGKKALKLYKENKVDMVFADWMMPKMDGIELCREITKFDAETGRKGYVIMVTAKTGKKDMLTALEAGADDFISKPYERAVLETRMMMGKRITKKKSIDAVTVLSEEHEMLTRMGKVLQAISDRLGKTIVPEKIIKWCGSTTILLDSRVHHKKEDYFVIKFLERAIEEQGESPKSKVFSRSSLKTIEKEHETLLEILSDLQKNATLYSRNEAKGEAALKETIESYLDLLEKHMDREERLLFPLSRKYLNDEDMAKLLTEFDKVEKDVGIENLDKRLEEIKRAEEILHIKA
jgi:CheY-like chemotaxis protein